MRHPVVALIGVCLSAATGAAQCTSGATGSAGDLPRVLHVGSAADDSASLGALLGACWGNPSLLRSSISLTPVATPGRWVVSAVDPELHTTWNSAIPESFNDGAMWAGRGLNVAASAGFQVQYRQLRAIIDPQIVSSQNSASPIIANPNELFSPFASPWHINGTAADLPLRFGDQSYTRLDPGESTIDLTVRGIGIGLSSASQWWGPGIRNALVMSDNAAGIPRGYLRTEHPWRTPVGDVEGQWMIGGLEESPFFDFDPRNNLRSVSGAAATLRLSADTGLTVGIGRVVYASIRRFGRLPGHVADVFLDWHRPGLTGATSSTSDQLTSLFARWIIPGAGMAIHVEWAKPRLPASMRELLVDPEANQGYTVGAEWAKTVGASTTVRTRLEFTDLDQTPLTVGGVTPEFYTSHAVIQGFTQEGQSVGAAIGPSSSSQFLGSTVYHDAWQLGANIGRIRWENGAYYRAPSEARFAWRAHDVSLFAGITARRDWSWTAVDVSVTRTLRMNYLFQTPNAFLPDNTTFDVRNVCLSVGLTPRLHR